MNECKAALTGGGGGLNFTAVKLRHLLITRFSLAGPVVAGRLKREEHYLDSDWLEERLDLFARACVPSVASQTGKCRWLIVCDSATPKWAIRQADHLVKDLSAEIALVRSKPGWPADLVRRHCSNEDWLLSTRLDSDDAVAPDFIARLQDETRGVHEFLNPLWGYQLDLRTKRVFRFEDEENPFVSLSEAIGPSMATVYCGRSHRALSTLAPIRQIEAEWLQIIHGGNVTNRILGNRIWASVARSRFAVDPSLFPDREFVPPLVWRAGHLLRRKLMHSRSSDGGLRGGAENLTLPRS